MPKKKGQAAVAKGGARRGRPRGSGAGQENQAVQSLVAYRAQLAAQRANLDAKLSAVDEALRVMGQKVAPIPGGNGRRGPRPGGGPREGSLKDYIARVLAGGQTLTVSQITEGVLKAGYETRNRTLAKSVGIALTEMNNVEKVARGQFRKK